jgi:ketosteroid isomerase-like protein
MSDEDVIRAAVAAWNEGGVDAFLEYVTDDIEWRHPTGFPEGDLWCGRDELRSQLHDQFDVVFDAGTVEVVSITRAPQGWLVPIRHSVKAQTSHMDLQWAAWFLMTVEGDLIKENRVFLDREQAEQAAGIEG